VASGPRRETFYAFVAKAVRFHTKVLGIELDGITNQAESDTPRITADKVRAVLVMN
jgi:hypothetical protein